VERDGTRGEGQESGSRPSDAEKLVGDTPASEPLTDARGVQPPERESRTGESRAADGAPTGDDAEREAELGHS